MKILVYHAKAVINVAKCSLDADGVKKKHWHSWYTSSFLYKPTFFIQAIKLPFECC